MKRDSRNALHDMTVKQRVLIIAELTRNMYVIDYWDAQLSSLRDHPELLKGKLKFMFNKSYRFINMYRSELMDAINSQEAREIFLDNVYEFHKRLSKMVGFYEQAIKRRLDRGHQEHTAFTHRFAVSKDLLDIATVIQGYEANSDKGNSPSYTSTPIYGMLNMGGFVKNISYASESRPDRYKNEPPSTLGTLVRLCGDTNKALLEAIHSKDFEFEVGEDKEIDRAVEISVTNIVSLMQDYEHIGIMFEDDGHTWEEAVSIMDERRDKQLKEITKAQHQLALKAAKKEAKKNERSHHPNSDSGSHPGRANPISCRDHMLKSVNNCNPIIQKIK